MSLSSLTVRIASPIFSPVFNLFILQLSEEFSPRQTLSFAHLKHSHLFQLINCPVSLSRYWHSSLHFVTLSLRHRKRKRRHCNGKYAWWHSRRAVWQQRKWMKKAAWARLSLHRSRHRSSAIIRHQRVGSCVCHAHAPTRLKQWALSNLLLLPWQVTGQVRRLLVAPFPSSRLIQRFCCRNISRGKGRREQ